MNGRLQERIAFHYEKQFSGGGGRLPPLQQPPQVRGGLLDQTRPREAPVGGSLAALLVRCEEASVVCTL